MASQSKRGPLIVEPPSQVRFPGPPLRPSRATIKLINNTTNRIAFKIKTTAPSFYGVRPNTGIVLPRNTADVEIARQPFTPEQSPKINHKFMVQSIVMPDDVDDVSKFWQTTDQSRLGIVKLRVVFEDIPNSTPSQPATLQKKPSDQLLPPKRDNPTKPLAEGNTNKLPTQPSARYMNQTSASLESIRRVLERNNGKENTQKPPPPPPLTAAIDYANAGTNTSHHKLVKASPNKGTNTSFEQLEKASPVAPPKTSSPQSSMNAQLNTSKPQTTSYLSNDTTSFVSHKPFLPLLGPVRSPSPRGSRHKIAAKDEMEKERRKDAQAIQKRELRRQSKRKSDDIFTHLQIATMNTEIHQLRTENNYLHKENTALKEEIQHRNHKQSAIRNEYVIPHSELPQPQQSLPICYVIASMTFAILCLIIGKFVL